MNTMQRLINCKHGKKELFIANRVGEWKYQCPECKKILDLKPSPRQYHCLTCKSLQMHDPVEPKSQGESQLPFDKWKCRSCGHEYLDDNGIPPSHVEQSDEGYSVIVNEGRVIGKAE